MFHGWDAAHNLDRFHIVGGDGAHVHTLSNSYAGCLIVVGTGLHACRGVYGNSVYDKGGAEGGSGIVRSRCDALGLAECYAVETAHVGVLGDAAGKEREEIGEA